MTPSVKPFKYVRCFASSNFCRSFCDLIFNSSQTAGAEASPYPGMLMIGITSNGTTHSSLTLNLALNASFDFKSDKAIKSSGESDGTEVTTPVPLVMEIVNIGNT